MLEMAGWIKGFTPEVQRQAEQMAIARMEALLAKYRPALVSSPAAPLNVLARASRDFVLQAKREAVEKMSRSALKDDITISRIGSSDHAAISATPIRITSTAFRTPAEKIGSSRTSSYAPSKRAARASQRPTKEKITLSLDAAQIARLRARVA